MRRANNPKLVIHLTKKIMKKILEKTYNHIPLSYEEAYSTLIRIGSGEVPELQTAAFISAYNMKEIAIDELRGFKDALLELCKSISLDAAHAIDMCGTGGDGKNTFNISTISAVVVAASGYKVIKHGNYGVSSLCGSSNVLEELGYGFSTNQDVLQKQLDQTNICFLHAPLFHPAMKHVAPIRREIGLKTFFNLLGPLVNPAQPSHQLAGVFNLSIARKYKYILEQDRDQFAVVHSIDGYDEATLTAPFKLMGTETDLLLSPSDLGFDSIEPEELHGGSTIQEAAGLFHEIVSGHGTQKQTQVVSVNAGLAIRCFEPSKQISECVEIARETIESGKAKQTLNRLLTN